MNNGRLEQSIWERLKGHPQDSLEIYGNTDSVKKRQGSLRESLKLSKYGSHSERP